ncbi:MAG: hypothetical protein NT069_21465 [Planctomycetota bacterium]|nr:hypothetical protein [Planctomycetota bacterium]
MRHAAARRTVLKPSHLLIWCLVWFALRAPLPVCHAHAAEAVRPCEAKLERHLQAHHPGANRSAWLDWHIHWVSPTELRSGSLTWTDDESSPSDSDSHSDEEFWSMTGAVAGPLGTIQPATEFAVTTGQWGRFSNGPYVAAYSAGGLMAVHRKPGGMRALIRVALC